MTESEYLHAVANRKPRLIFLLDPDAQWVPGYVDGHTGEGDDGAKIKMLRARLENELLVDHFRSPEDLARRVSVRRRR